MFKFKRTTIPIAIVCLLIFALFVISGCGQKQEASAPKQEQTKKEEPKKEEAKKEKPKGGTLGTASIGGTFYVWGGGWSKLISEKVNFPISVEVTGGPVHNIQLVDKGDMTFGLASMPAAYDGWAGLGWAKGKKFQNIRVVLPMYPSYETWWSLKSSGIKKIQDLNGRVINLAPKGGTPDTYGRRILDILGIKPAKIVNSGFNDLVGQLLDGMVEAGYTTGGLNHPAVMQTEASKPINVFTSVMNEEDAKKILKELPSFYLGKLPKGAYKAVTSDIPALQYWNVLVTNKDLPEDLIYEITKAYFANLNAFKDVYKPTMNTVPEDITKSAIPIHKGALKFYKEKGVKIPDNLVPPEAK
ncbi:MAG: uncharacterized protein PWP65_640 [Clostridia bacterium]|nr:uncharacterized protein [Clostridia bacterium]